LCHFQRDFNVVFDLEGNQNINSYVSQLLFSFDLSTGLFSEIIWFYIFSGLPSGFWSGRFQDFSSTKQNCSFDKLTQILFVESNLRRTAPKSGCGGIFILGRPMGLKNFDRAFLSIYGFLTYYGRDYYIAGSL